MREAAESRNVPTQLFDPDYALRGNRLDEPFHCRRAMRNDPKHGRR